MPRITSSPVTEALLRRELGPHWDLNRYTPTLQDLVWPVLGKRKAHNGAAGVDLTGSLRLPRPTAGDIPTRGLRDELRRVYHNLATGKPRERPWVTPESFGYSAGASDRERMVEAIRAYLVDPNYLKTVAPKTAGRIRNFANTHPELSKIVQFNSLAALGLSPLAAQGEDQSDEF